MAGLKFRLTSSLQALAGLILLSATADSLQCYWCGPLAEQVHRSQRAPPCDTISSHVTACEPGYTHCAVVASSPPFVESRYCVKFYQDECYTLYCNSTKTFRMTCPCRGELCNGQNTQREIDAFAVLGKTIAKTQNTRLKRSAIVTNKFVVNKSHENTNLIKNDDEKEMMNDTKSNMDNNIDDSKNEISAHNQINDLTNDTMMQSDDPLVNKENNESPVDSNHVAINNGTDMMETTTNNENEARDDDTETTQKIMEVSEIITTSATLEQTMEQQMTVKENQFIGKDIMSSMELPTAEALQQEAGLIVTTEKSSELKNLESPFITTLTTIESHSNTEPTSTRESRNNGIKISAGSLLINLIIFNNFIMEHHL